VLGRHDELALRRPAVQARYEALVLGVRVRRRVGLGQGIESGAYRKPLPDEHRRRLAERLVEVEGFERYLRRAFLGQKQFSIEGLDALIPMLDETLELWQKTIDEKLRTLDELYQILRQDQTNLWMIILEVSIVALFVLDIVKSVFN